MSASTVVIAPETHVEFHIARRGRKPEPVFDEETAVKYATGVWVDVPAGVDEPSVLAFVAEKVAQIKREVMSVDADSPRKIAQRLPTTAFTRPGYARWSVRLTRAPRYTL